MYVDPSTCAPCSWYCFVLFFWASFLALYAHSQSLPETFLWLVPLVRQSKVGKSREQTHSAGQVFFALWQGPEAGSLRTGGWGRCPHVPPYDMPRVLGNERHWHILHTYIYIYICMYVCTHVHIVKQIPGTFDISESFDRPDSGGV